MPRFTITLSPEVRDVITRCTSNGNAVILPSNMDRKLYVSVNAALEAAGGKWSKKAKAHLFPSDAGEILRAMLESGSVKNEAKDAKVTRQAFYTPADVAATVAQLAQVGGMAVLEPSAGSGALAEACQNYGASSVFCMEIDKAESDILNSKGFPSHNADFLTKRPENGDALFDRVVMNPPFTRKSDAKHVLHAFAYWLKPGGILTAIVADDGRDREDIQNALIPTELSHVFSIPHRLPKGAFKESGTQIAALVIQIVRAF